MNFPEKSARFVVFTAGLFLLGLVGCDDVEMPHYFSGNEVPLDVMAEPRLVATPTVAEQADQTYPRMADTPQKPKDFSSPQLVSATLQQMEGLSAEGTTVHNEYAPNFAPSLSDKTSAKAVNKAADKASDMATQMAPNQ